jgi:hypothetical protein
MKFNSSIVQKFKGFGLMLFSFLTLNLEPLNLELRAARAHPGKTDKDGCHKVAKDYKYNVSKKVLKAGTTHCHGGMGKMRLGKEILEDPYEQPKLQAPKTKGKTK